jgi:hypothetical protein
MPYKDKTAAQQAKKRYREANPEKCREASRISREKNVVSRLLKCSKENAKTTGKEHSITKEDIIIPEYCPYFGIKLTNILGQGRLDTNPSIDRIDNTKGYTKGNVQIISWKANRFKSNLTEEELIFFAKSILQIHC